MTGEYCKSGGGEIDDWVNDIHQGDAKEVLREMPESSVHMVMTSPPYYGLRDYGDETITVWGGDDDCEHQWDDREVYQDSPVRRGGPDQHDTTAKDDRWRTTGRCVECGARREQLGLEEQLDDYIQDLVEVGEEIRRVLRDDGTWWLNLGDSFASASGWGSQSDEVGGHDAGVDNRASTFQRKQKMLIPHRVAIALQKNGWIVRSDAPWVKPNPMPDPVKDRFREDKEFVFHLNPSPDYWFDLDSIREPHKEVSIQRSQRKNNPQQRQSVASEETLNPDQFVHSNGKNPGDILEITVQPYPEAHFAVYPPDLVEKPVKATCPPNVCAECGTPYDREAEVVDREIAGGVSRVPENERGYDDRQGKSQNDREGLTQPTERKLGEWKQQCNCDTDETKPGIVLDPFIGAGTTAVEAKRLNRRFVGIDLNPEYVAMAQRRVGIDVDEPDLLLDENEQLLSAFADGGTGT